jgi:penicillin-binding protein 1A
MRPVVRAPGARPSRAAVALAAALVAAPVLPAPVGAQSPAATRTGEPWRIVALPQSSVIFARDGSTIIGEVGRQVRTSVALRTLPRYLPAAFIAVEDKRFHQHNGVDVVGIAGALRDAVGGDARGASTITQQLVGNMHPDAVDRRDRSIERKVREQQAAIEMERRYSKEQILEAYLNTIYFNHGWYGIDAAARHYFGKPAARVTLAEAASLAAMPKSPVLYDPSRYADRNRQRRDLILDLMAEQGYVTRAQAAAAKAEPVRVADDDGVLGASRYFVRVVQLQAQRAGVALAEGGYRVLTTLDPALQTAAATALASQTAALERTKGWRHQTLAQYQRQKAAGGAGAPAYLQGAVVAMDPVTGEIRALVGGRDYDDSPYNRAVEARRQPGSSFKPFVYAAAIAQGVPPNAVVGDTAVRVALPDGRVYAPGNADNQFLGLLTMREALARSRNPVAVELWQRATPDSVIALARRAGVNATILPYPSSALGATAVRPIDFVAAYATFATLGERPDPRFLARVEDRTGRTVYSAPASTPTAALDPRVSFIVRDILRDAVDRGTASSVRRLLPARIPAAGKTGTTNDNADVWFVGMTPDLVGGVWLGFDQPKTIASGAAGGSLAAPVWAQMVARWYGSREAGDAWNAPPPDGVVAVELDRQTGLPADSLTPPARRHTEYFLDGTQPGAQAFEPLSIFRAGAVGPR